MQRRLLSIARLNLALLPVANYYPFLYLVLAKISLAKAVQQNKKCTILTPFFHADYKPLLEHKIRTLGYAKNCVDIIEIDIQSSTEETMQNIKQVMLVATKTDISSIIIYSGYLLQYKNLIKHYLTAPQQLIEPLKASIEFVANLINNEPYTYQKKLNVPDAEKIKFWLETLTD